MTTFTEASVITPAVIAAFKRYHVTDGFVLDVGCLGSNYHEELPRFIGVDPRNPSVLSPNCQFLQASIISDRIPDQSIHTMLAVNVIGYVGQDAYDQLPFELGPELAVYNMLRILRPGGHLIITAPVGLSESKQSSPGQIRTFSAEEWGRLIHRASVVEEQYFLRRPDAYGLCSVSEIIGLSYGFNYARGVGFAVLRRDGDPADPTTEGSEGQIFDIEDPHGEDAFRVDEPAWITDPNWAKNVTAQALPGDQSGHFSSTRKARDRQQNSETQTSQKDNS